MSRKLIERVLGPAPYAVDEVEAPTAAKLYEMWHQKEPDGAHVVQFEFPRTLVPIGPAERIIYRSDKWEDDGKEYTYEHDFDSQPMVYTAATGAPLSELACGREVATSTIIRGDVNGRFELPMLALVEAFTFRPEGQKPLRLYFSRETPLMCMTEDAKGLIVFAHIDGVACPLFVRGGRMHVTSHGIVH